MVSFDKSYLEWLVLWRDVSSGRIFHLIEFNRFQWLTLKGPFRWGACRVWWTRWLVESPERPVGFEEWRSRLFGREWRSGTLIPARFNQSITMSNILIHWIQIELWKLRRNLTGSTQVSDCWRTLWMAVKRCFDTFKLVKWCMDCSSVLL